MICYQEIHGECCRDSIRVQFKCDDRFRLLDICMDGTIRGVLEYCGVGYCNIFGCNCDGGCKRGTVDSAIEKFQRLFPYLLRIM